jgi:hypothetical protein
MRIKLAFAAITVACLGVVACQPSESAAPVPANCETLAQLPAPDSRHVSGARMVSDAQQDGATPEELSVFCFDSVATYPNW